MAAGSKKVQTKKKTSTGRKPGRPAGSTVKRNRRINMTTGY